MRAEKRNVLTLAACQALFQTASVLIMTVGGLAGQMLAADKSLATLPIASMSVGTAAGHHSGVADHAADRATGRVHARHPARRARRRASPSSRS